MMDSLDDDMDDGDIRAVELSTLQAIYPELVVHADSRYSFTLEVPVNPVRAVTVAFPAAGMAENTQRTASHTAAALAAAETGLSNDINLPGKCNIDTHELTFLPSLNVRITLPESYPEQMPPRVVVTTAPPWLPSAVVSRLENDCAQLWEELGHDQVVFAYIDHIHQAADDCVFGLVNKSGLLAVDMEHKASILNYDVAAKQAAFDKQTFDCGICLEGDLASVRCLEPNCAKERSAAAKQLGKGSGKPKMASLSPGELLQIPLPEDLVRRYIDLKYKTALESDKNTVYCPRAWCRGAARSKKHRKPVGLALHESDDEAEEIPEGKGKRRNSVDTDDRLAICEDCCFAFCNRCLLSWHGEFVYCSPPRNVGELAEEDKASLEYLAHHTTPCPTCAAPAQKTMGCNHMICFRCNTHFCYLCSSWLDSNNPYRHFGEGPDGRRTGCFQRLWELEEGDEGDGDGHVVAFRGRANGLAAIDSDDSQDVLSDEEDDSSDNEGMLHAGNQLMLPAAAPRQQQQQQRHGAAAVAVHALARQAAVAREGPLVLRIALGAPVPVAVPPAAPNNAINNAARAPAVAPRRGMERGRAGGGPVRGGRQVAGRRRGGREGGQARGRGRNNLVRGRRREAAAEAAENGENAGDADLAIAAWVRNFVGLALEDNEDGD
ncbi:hypothetical protein SEPCBS119000_002364 [Sporothrix epigloea]|uniref:RBR-type E3 ubiquitin transferase n=1 Tax=Sporothrix epigloea TaxID=1892477 RepID=A0ABP0DFT3_9PEZI